MLVGCNDTYKNKGVKILKAKMLKLKENVKKR